MDYSELQLIWNEQNKRTMFAFDQEVLEREVMKESRLSHFHLRSFEYVSSALLVGIAIAIGIETYLQEEYFQIGGILIMLCAAALIFFSGRSAESKLRQLGDGVLAHADKGILQTQRMIALILRFFTGFCCYLIYGTVVRGIVYQGFAHSEVKLIVTVTAPILMYFLLRWELKKVHEKRLVKLKALREKISESE